MCGSIAPVVEVLSERSQFVAPRTSSFSSAILSPSLPQACLYSEDLSDKQNLTFVLSSRFDLVVNAHQCPQLCARLGVRYGQN